MEPVCCSVSGSNCCFLACIQISQEAGKVVWYSHLLKNFPQFIVIHTVKSFGIVNKSEVDVFLELSHFFYDPVDVGIWSLVPLPFQNSAWISKFSVHILLKPGLENFEHYFASLWDEYNCAVVLVLPFFGIGMITDLFQKWNRKHVHTKISSWMFKVALFIKAKKWRQPKFPPICGTNKQKHDIYIQ